MYKYIKSGFMIIASAFLLTTSAVYVEEALADAVVEPVVKSVQQVNANVGYLNVKPMQIVNYPKSFLNKKVLMNAKFDKFATLVLDYKPAFKSSEEYISFLIKRDDTLNDIPLSEMKLFLKRDVAEKFIDLKTNDEIEIKGVVFSDALGDAWIDVTQLNIINKAPETK